MKLGGFGGAPKFPQPSLFELFWRVHRETGAEQLGQAVTVTLDRMAQGGIYDHVGGGFARYSVDEEWLVPHFEKMLYDNAQLVELMTTVWQKTRSRLYAERIAETIDWLAREMTHPEGGFFSSLDADSEGEEGKFYVWTVEELDQCLGADATLFKAAYDAKPGGNWEGHTILNRSNAPDFAADDIEARLARCRETLLAARAKRVRPGLDDKILADWNGLMIAALAHAGTVFERMDWLAMAERAFAFVKTRMSVDGRLRRSWCRDSLRHPATLDDYANMTRGALALFEATGQTAYLEQARAWVAVADRHHWDNASGGYFFAADDTDDVIHRTKTVQDQAVPSGNGTMAAVLARLFLLTGDHTYRARADALIKAFSGELGRNIFGLGSLLAAHAMLGQGRQIVVIAKRDDARLAPMLRAIHGVSLPSRVIHVVDPGIEFPLGHPVFGKTASNGQPTAYVCRGPVCSLPLTTPDALAAALAA
jgi:uncharacterized protein YyaL (SSP411 family)